VIAALAVAAAAVLIGTHFASPDIQVSPTKKVVVPVIAPLDDPSDKKSRSEVIGHTEVTLPGSNNATVPLGEQQLINDVTGSPDPHGAIIHHGGGGSGAPAADPCAPATGPVPADCPAGSTGRIRPDLAPMWVNVLAFAPAHSATPEDPRCPAVASVAGEVPVGVSAPAPAHYELQYWPIGSPSSRSMASVDTEAADRTDYQSAADDTTVGTADLPIQHSCLVLHVDPTLSYSGQVIATDDNGRASDPTPVTFDGSAGEVHPELEVSTIGDNVLVASAVARDDQHVEFVVAQVNAGDPEPACNSLGGREPLQPGVTLSVAYVAAHHWPDRFTLRFTATVTVGFGKRVLVCALWYEGTVAHGLIGVDPSVAPLYVSRQIVSSPDKLVPTLTTTGFVGGTGVSQLTVSTSTGVVCLGRRTSSFGLSSVAISPLPYDLCSATFDGRVQSDPMANSFMVSVDNSATFVDGHYTNRAAIDAPLLPCVGSCVVPDPQNYRVPIDPSSNARGWWDFQLVYRAAANGTRQAGWTLGGIESTAGSGGPAASSGPTFDITAAVTSTGFDAAHFTAAASVPVTINEPVDYAIRILPGETSGLLQCPSSPVPHAEGHLDHSGVVTIPGLCLASSYHAQVTLTDAAGHTKTWDALGTDPDGLWLGAVFRTPGLPSTIHWDLAATGVEHGYVSDIYIQLQGLYNSTVLDTPLDPIDGHCVSDGHLHLSGTADGSLINAVSLVQVQYRIRSTSPDHVRCIGIGSEPMVTTGSLTPVTLQDLVNGAPAVTITDPAGRYTLTLSLVPTP
jgi:hypothetical protein